MGAVSLIPDAEAFHREGNSIAILMVHGFTGSPASIKPWAEALHREGFTVRVPRLPGHGRTWQEMNQTRWQEWFSEVEEHFDELKGKYSKVFVAGFSMGGALSLHLASQRSAEIEGLILVNPAIHDRRAILRAVPLLKYLIPSIGGRGTDVAAPNPPRHSYGRTPLRALHSLQRLWRIVESNLDKVTTPLMVGYSINDHVVDPINSETVINNVSSIDIREVIFPNSYHNVALDHDLDLLVSESIAFIRDVLSGELSRDDEDLIDAEFEAIVAGLSLDESAPTSYLDNLDALDALERYDGDNSPLPRLTQVQRGALAAVIGGPLYSIMTSFFGFDPIGLGAWPGLLILLIGVATFFWQMRPESDDDDGVAL